MPDLVLALIIVAAIAGVLSVVTRHVVFAQVAQVLDQEVSRREVCHGSQVRCALVENHPTAVVDALK